jgi:hypothetical protein
LPHPDWSPRRNASPTGVRHLALGSHMPIPISEEVEELRAVARVRWDAGVDWLSVATQRAAAEQFAIAEHGPISGDGRDRHRVVPLVFRLPWARVNHLPGRRRVICAAVTYLWRTAETQAGLRCRVRPDDEVGCDG